ncbi:MAG: MAPEG family protein [Gammaproteobacteria bacterium]
MAPAAVAILWPMIAQVLLTGVVWVVMFRRRISEMTQRRIPPDAVALSGQASEKLQDTAAADNFRNLFEIPVLFYVGCLSIAVFDLVTSLQLGLAWAFVLLRVGHSAIQLTYNRVMHRFYAYLLSSLCVFAMWALLATALMTRQPAA